MAEDFTMVKKKCVDGKSDDGRNKNDKIKKNGKKKHGWVFKCLISCLIIFVILTGAIIGGAFWAWGKYVEPGMQMSLPKFLGILGDAYSYNEKKIVTHPFSPEEDLASFYLDFKRKMMLDPETPLNIADILAGKFNGNTQTDGEAVAENSNIETKAADTTGNASLDKLLRELKFDFSVLRAYDGSPTILEVTDKQIAAFLNEVFSILDFNGMLPQLAKIEQEYGIKIKDTISIKQVLIDSKTKGDVVQPRLSITMKIELKSMLNAIIAKQGYPKIISGLLPKKLFVTMYVFPNEQDGKAEIAVNSITPEDLNALITGINGVMAMYGGGDAFDIDRLFQSINNAIVSAINSVNKFLPISFVESGSIQAKPIEALMSLLKVDVSEGQFMYMLKDIKLPTLASLGFDKYTDTIRSSEVKTFINNFSSNYGLSDEVAGTIKPETVFSQIKQIATAPNFVDTINLKSGLCNYNDPYASNKDLLKVRTSYMAFAGIINSFLKDSAASLGNLVVTALKMEYFVDNNTIFGVDKDRTDVMSILISLDLHAMLKIDPNSLFGNVMAQLVPKDIFIEVYLDMNTANGRTPYPALISLNNTAISVTKEHFATITQLLAGMGKSVEYLNYDYLALKVETLVNDQIKNIEKMLKADIKFEKDNVVLPNIFEVVSGTTFVNPDGLPEGAKKFNDEEIYNSLSNMYTYKETQTNCDGKDATSFVREMNKKFYFKNKVDDEKYGFDGVGVEKDDVLDGESMSAVYDKLTQMSSTFQDDISVQRMVRDDAADSPLAELMPYLTDYELGVMISSAKVKDASGKETSIININGVSDFRVLGSYITTVEGKIMLNLYGSAKIVIPETTPPTGGEVVPTPTASNVVAKDKYSGIMPDAIFFQMEIDTTALVKAVQVNIDKDKPAEQQKYPLNADGKPTEKLSNGNVVEIDIDFLKKLTVNGLNDTQVDSADGMTDLSRFLLLVNRLTKVEFNIVTLSAQIESSVLKIMSDMLSNGTMAIEFIGDTPDTNGKTNAMKINTTIYDIAISQIYKRESSDPVWMLGVPSAKEFRQVLSRASVVPASIENIPPDMDEWKKEQLIITDKIVKEFNTKYYFTEENKLKFKDMTEEEKLNASIMDLFKNSNLKENYMMVVDGMKLAGDSLNSTVDNVDEVTNVLASMMPFFNKAEITRLLIGALSIKVAGIKDTQISEITYVPGEVRNADAIVTTTNTPNGKLQIVLKGTISMTDETKPGELPSKYAVFVPPSVRIVVDIDFGLLMQDIAKLDKGQINDPIKIEEEIAAGRISRNYCTFTINNMTNTNYVYPVTPETPDANDPNNPGGRPPVDEIFRQNDMSCFISIFTKITRQSLAVDTVTNAISDVLRTQVRNIASGAQISFVVDNTTQANSGMKCGGIFDIATSSVNVGYPTEPIISAPELMDTFKSLWAEPINNVGSTAEGFDTVNDIKSALGTPPTSLSIRVNERYIASSVVNNKKKLSDALHGLKEANLIFNRVGLLDYSLVGASRPSDIKRGEFDTALDTNKYLMMFLGINSAGIIGKQTTLLPVEIPITLAICMTDSAKDSMIFADLSAAQMKVLERLITLNALEAGVSNTGSMFNTENLAKITAAIRAINFTITTPTSLTVTLGDILSGGVIENQDIGDGNGGKWLNKTISIVP